MNPLFDDPTDVLSEVTSDDFVVVKGVSLSGSALYLGAPTEDCRKPDAVVSLHVCGEGRC